MGKFTLFCILALVVALAVPAYAEVQNVKVSGDITTRYLYRSNYDLTKNNDAFTSGDSVLADTQSFFMSDVGVNVAADLTDNVSTMVRLVAQRDWDIDGAASSDINIDLGYVTLKEMLYAPLTVTVGRQDLLYGKGFIIGSSLLAGNVDPDSSISANEYNDLTAFDAIKATLDYNPLTIGLLYSKVDKAATVSYDDIDLYGVNASYKFNKWDAEAEAYLFAKEDRSVSPSNKIDTVGARGSLVPVENLNVFGELAYQFGDYRQAAATTRDRAAWALDLGADYTWKKLAWTPNLALEYVYFSGEEAGTSTGDYNAWDSMYRGATYTLIREFATTLYATTDSSDAAGTSNQHQLLVSGSIKPLDSLTAKLLWGHFEADEKYVAGRSEEIGDEIDITLTYDYTKDVQFGLTAGLFMPGKYYQSPDDATATAVVSSMKVTF